MKSVISTIVYQYIKNDEKWASLKNTCQCAIQHTVIISLDYLGCDVVKGYSKTSEERTIWDWGFCPLFGGCPL